MKHSGISTIFVAAMGMLSALYALAAQPGMTLYATGTISSIDERSIVVEDQVFLIDGYVEVVGHRGEPRAKGSLREQEIVSVYAVDNTKPRGASIARKIVVER